MKKARLRPRWAIQVMLAALALIFTSGALAAEKKRIVVGDPHTSWVAGKACRGHAPNYADTIARSLRSRIIESGAFRVVSRGQLKKILKEHEMAMTGLADASQAKAVGRLLQADLVMTTEVLCHPTSVEFTAQLIDVETGEFVWSKTYEMANLRKVSRALKDIAKLLASYARTGAIGESAGKSEKMMMIDSKALHDAADAIITTIQRAVPDTRATVEDVNPYAGTVKVKLHGRGYAGLGLLVRRDDEDVGWLYLKKKGSGLVEAITRDDISSFEEGDEASSETFKPKVAIGYIEDEDEQDEDMVEMFRKGLLDEMSEADGLEPVDDSQVDRLLQRMGSRVRKNTLAKLFKAGVDLLIMGRFSGERGNRRIDFDVLSTVDGKKITRIKYDSRL